MKRLPILLTAGLLTGPLAAWLAVLLACFAPARAAEGDKPFRIAADEFGPVYHVDMDHVESAADLTAVPGVKMVWDLDGNDPSGWLANARDVDGDGRIELIVAVETGGRRCIVRYDQDGRRIWTSGPVNHGLGHESGMAIEDLNGDGTYEVVFNALRQLWCLDANTGKTNWQIDLPECRDNHQVSIVGRFLDRQRFAVVCRVYHDVICYDAAGKKAWTYHIDNKSAYGHEMTHDDADGDGLDEVYVSLDGKFLALGGDGKLRWADTSCRNHSDFIFCGDVDADGDREIVYDGDGCAAMRGPIVCADGRTGEPVRQWTYARPGKDHLQRAALGDFDPSRTGLELAAVGKRHGMGGLMLFRGPGQPAWTKDIPTGWVTSGDFNGDGKPEIILSGGTGNGDGWEVWTGAGQRVYALAGIGGIPLGVESAGRKRPDLDGNGKADILLVTDRGYLVLMECLECLGFGYSSVTIAHDTIYTAGNIDERTAITALDLDGKVRWRFKGYPAFVGHMLGTRATPTIDGDRLYHKTPLGDVFCLNAKTGEEYWGVNILEKFGSENIEWALAESLLVDGDRVICCPGGPNTAVVALDKMTSETVWKSETAEGDLASYSSPIPVEQGGLRIVLNMTAKALIGVNADTGKLLFRFPHKTQFDANVCSPVGEMKYAEKGVGKSVWVTSATA